MTRWWFPTVPLGRVAALRMLVYAYIPVDVALSGSWVQSHARLGGTLYEPLRVARVLRLPDPTSTLVAVVEVAVIASAVAAVVSAALGRSVRATGTAAGLLYLAWMLIAMSYGKVDHDRFAFLVALAVLPTVGRAAVRDRTPSAAAGWALRCVQVSVVLTYFLAALAKIRFGGWNWPTGSTLELALLRRNTPFSTWLIDKPQLLVPMQFAMIGLELASPLVLLARSDRGRTLIAIGMWVFHLVVFSGVTIIFLPHCVAIASFVPLEVWWERLSATVRERRPVRRLASAQPDG
ncbi:MAG: MFS transporter permease [Actinomycetota bacterium]